MKIYSSNRSGSFNLTIIIVVAVAIFSGMIAYYFTNINNENNVDCTLEAKQCPDGSHVGRSGPNCEFEKCSESATTTDQIIIERWSAWGPCPSVASECSRSMKLYYSGKLIFSGAVNKEKKLSVGDMKQIIDYIESSGIMSKTCSESNVVDGSIGYTINFNGATKRIDGLGSCENDLRPIEKIINAQPSEKTFKP